mgnify:FL=1
MTKSKTEKNLEEGIEKVEEREEKEEKVELENQEKTETKSEKKEVKKHVHERPKKTEAVVMAENIPISTKDSSAICRFIRGKKIEDAIKDLEAVLKFKKIVPMTGEIPHRKGKGMMSGRYPKKASENFIKLLKSLKANSNYNGLENPVIVEAVPNIGMKVMGRFGSVRKKRTHIKIVAKDVEEKVKNKK